MTEVRVLGPVELRAPDGSEVSLTPRARRLLAALAVRAGADAGVDWLIDAVWDADQPATPESALQTQVSRLRSALRGAGCTVQVATRPDGYRLLAPGGTLDAARFVDLVQGARGPTESRRRAGLLVEALALWRGSAYADVADAAFAEAEAARLTELRAGAVEELAATRLSLGQPDLVLHDLPEHAAAHPFRERPPALLMRALYAVGRTPEALATYQRFRDRLVDELGLDPSPELVALHQAILSGEEPRSMAVVQDAGAPRTAAASGEAGTAGSAAPLTTEPSPADRPPPDSPPQHSRPQHYRPQVFRPRRGSLPRHGGPAASGLIGRDADGAELVEALRVAAVVTVVGPGGLGKTSLATQVAADLDPDFADGTLVCELSRVSTGEQLAPAMCTALGLTVPAGEASADRVLAHLRDRQLLLLLDNCEHVAEAVGPLVRRISEACPDVTVLATSRVSLGVPAERVFALEPLAATGAGDHQGPAVELFLARARQRLRDYQPDAATLAQIATVCERLDGLPLAIELAAATMDAISPAEMLDRWAWRMTALRGGPASEPRHRSLHALVDWSFDRLPPTEQQLFTLVSVFAGDFSLADAEDVADRAVPDLGRAEVLGGLISLVDHSMVTRSAPSGRFALLETMRSYGRERLAAAPWGERACQAHAEHYADLVRIGYDSPLGTGHDAEVRAQVEAIDELRAAFGWSLAHRPELAARLVGGSIGLLELTMLTEVADWADRLLAAADGQLEPATLARAHAVVAAGARYVGALDRCREQAERADDLAGDDLVCRGYAALLIAEQAGFSGDRDTVEAQTARITELASGHDALQPMAQMVLLDSVLTRAYTGAPAGVQEVTEIESRCRRHGWPVPATWAVFARGELLLDADPGQAAGLLDDARHRARQLGDRYLAGVALVSAASARARLGDVVAAAGQFSEVVAHWRSGDDWTHQWPTLRNVVQVLIAAGRPEAAAVLATALRVPARDATGFGSDAELLAATTDRLAAELGERFAALAHRGRTSSDQQLVMLALRELAVVSGQPVEPEEAEVLDRQH